nr:GWxTD domain-containing protein [Melioribacteraceae bacterium]
HLNWFLFLCCAVLIVHLSVLWYDKPKSLENTEQAIEYLETIGFKHSADSLLDFSDDEEYQALFHFWKEFDDDSSTSFNPVFKEFYSRIDFVRNEYNTLGKSDGADTDRGRTYIVYGKPDNIERTFKDVYDVIEIWEYKLISEKIYFSDKTGTGKFERIK